MKTKDSNLSKKIEHTGRSSPLFVEFKTLVESVKGVEEKLSQVILFMKESLCEPRSPRFKDFWDAKRLCISLFKQQMNRIKRNHLWSEYTELNKEAHQLKELLDQESTFSAKQIELAIQSLETDFASHDAWAHQMGSFEIPKSIKKFILDRKIYERPQVKLDFLKRMIDQLDALKSELIGTKMRVGLKNRLLKRVSKLGDQIFPLRKELIKGLSESFTSDVETFVKKQFDHKKGGASVRSYLLKSEIKGFQALAKRLTLNTHSFTKTRKMLGDCWEKVKGMEKDQKEEEKILKIQEGGLEKIRRKMRRRSEEKRSQLEKLKLELSELFENESQADLQTLSKIESRLSSSFRGLPLLPVEKQEIERKFLDLTGVILDKKEASIDSLSELRAVLSERQELVDQVKQQVEEYRKEMGGSSLDFEKAMTYRELYDRAKIDLDRQVGAMVRLETKIVEKES